MAEIAMAYVLGFGGGVFVGLITAMWLIHCPADGVSASGPHPLPAQANDGGEHG